MRLVPILGSVLMAVIPAIALAQDVMPPKYPPGFDCSKVPAGSQRQACQDSNLNSGPDVNKKQSPAGGALQTPGTVSPPTVPDQPGTENGNNGAGSSGLGAGSNGSGQ